MISSQRLPTPRKYVDTFRSERQHRCECLVLVYLTLPSLAKSKDRLVGEESSGQKSRLSLRFT